MGIFCRSKDEVWRQLSEEIGATVVVRSFCKGSKVQSRVGPWTITLDTHTESTGHAHVTYTRMRAPFVNADGFRFTIYRKSVLSGLGKLLGMQDIEIGDPEFDDAFTIKGADESKVRELFGNPKLVEMISSQPKFRLTVKDSEGWWGPTFPENVDELHFQVVGVIKDVERLKSLFELFAAVLDRLCQIGVAYKEIPNVYL